jgi:DNA-binding response OmpR family regulator
MKKILIIDDEKEFCAFIKETLELTGKYEVITATDGRSGMKIAMSQKPDLVLLDIMMPVVDGFKVLETLKKDEKTISIPIIMLTAKDDDESMTKAATLYDQDYIVKPVKIEELRNRIDKALNYK